MDIFDAIFTRRSIRKFTDTPISDAHIERILQAAMAAPSAHNKQPWKFIIVRDKERFAGIAERNQYAQMALHASVCIAVCADTRPEDSRIFWQQDCAAAIQNMLLAARGLGIGSVWTGIYPNEERAQAFSEFFALPQGVIPIGIVVCGYPDQPFKTRDTYDTGKIFYEKWDESTEK